jgi:redox-sensitive bicupin YhaK (pirin superfamily)
LTLIFRPAAERFHSELDWLDSWHSFSFAAHQDPEWMGFGPLRVINDDTIAPGHGFGMHPHHDMEIITVMVEGQLSHRDSMGHAEVLAAGEVQAMGAGTGLVHSEINQSDRPCRLLQIWIEPSSIGRAPTYRQQAFSIGASWTALIGDGAMAIDRPVKLWRAQPQPAGLLDLPIGPDQMGWFQLINGCGVVHTSQGGEPISLQRGDGLGFGPGSFDGFEAGPQGADLLLFELG